MKLSFPSLHLSTHIYSICIVDSKQTQNYNKSIEAFDLIFTIKKKINTSQLVILTFNYNTLIYPILCNKSISTFNIQLKKVANKNKINIKKAWCYLRQFDFS